MFARKSAKMGTTKAIKSQTLNVRMFELEPRLVFDGAMAADIYAVCEPQIAAEPAFDAAEFSASEIMSAAQAVNEVAWLKASAVQTAGADNWGLPTNRLPPPETGGDCTVEVMTAMPELPETASAQELVVGASNVEVHIVGSETELHQQTPMGRTSEAVSFEQNWLRKWFSFGNNPAIGSTVSVS